MAFSQNFGSATVPLNASTSLTFTISNSGAGLASNLGFTNTLPSGLEVATPNALSNTCNGTPTAVAGTNTISLAGGSLGSGTPVAVSCSFTVNVTGTSLGPKVSSPSALTPSNTLAANATLTVIAAAVAAASIPTLSEWGLILLVLAMGVSGFWAWRRQR